MSVGASWALVLTAIAVVYLIFWAMCRAAAMGERAICTRRHERIIWDTDEDLYCDRCGEWFLTVEHR